MPRDVTMPQLGESVAEGTIGRWIKHEGDMVEKDESLAEIITDKITAELPSPFAGRLVKILVPEDARVDVGTPIAQIEEVAAADTEAVPAMSAEVAAAGSSSAAVPAGEDEASLGAIAMAAGPGLRRSNVGTLERKEGERQRLSPLVRRLAQEHQIDLAQIMGTGLAGRVRKDDVLNYLAQRGRQAPAASPAQPALPQPTTAPVPAPTVAAIAPGAGDRTIPLSELRRALIASMVQGKDEAPQAISIMEIDMANLVAWQEQHAAEVEIREKVRITHVPFVIKVVVAGLKQFPLLNAVWGGDQIILKKDIHIGVSVPTDDGMMIPVIRYADTMNVLGLARTIMDYTQRAQVGKLSLEDIRGGTFTVNNPGVFGTVCSSSNINYPQAAVLTMDAVIERPVAVNRMLGIRPIMCLCLTFDQRVVDSATAGRFLKFVKDRLEGPIPDIHG